MRLVLSCIFSLIVTLATSQSNFGVALPLVYNHLSIKNNYGPSRDLKGSSIGSGVALTYSIHPRFVSRYKGLFLDLSVGYLTQKFNIERPFHYPSPAQLLYYTKDYSYNNVTGGVGLSYQFTLSNEWLLHGSVQCNWLKSFRQHYTPTYTSGTGPTTSNNDQGFYFGFTTSLAVGLSKKIHGCSFGASILIPVYSQWRKDSIFEDDPSEFFNPGVGIGTSLFFKYWIKNKNPETL